MRLQEPARLRGRLLGLLILLVGLLPLANAQDSSFVAFESGQVRPIALSPDGRFLYAVNTPDNRLEIFRTTSSVLIPIASVPVGMEPVAVATGPNNTIWVTNKLSDNVSIIKRNANGFRVIKTLNAGDEPQDIVFGGPEGNLAFISAARRDISRPKSSTLGNADIWVFDGADLSQPGPVKVINLFTDVPRGLAVSPDGNDVYAASHMSGNRTTVVSEKFVAGDIPPPLDTADGVAAPNTAIIVRNEGELWLDALDRDWSRVVAFELTDFDVFRIDASGAEPILAEQFEDVGTTLFNVAINPVNGEVYVSNLEARNHVRFEGPGIHGGTTLNGNFATNRITVINGDGVAPRNINKHLDFSLPLGTPEENETSLAFPLQMEITADGATMYVAALGSDKIGIFDTASLSDDTFVPDSANHISVPGGPTGIALDETRGFLYVLTRYNNSVTTVDLATGSPVAQAAMFNPEPASLIFGRRFLYDARFSSSRGDSACASCHIFADKDEIAWNLGNPDGLVEENPNPIIAIAPDDFSFHPMKGPMTTQSLRGMANHGPMHWRGDKTGGNDPDSLDPLDEKAAFVAFNGAFPNLLGREDQIPDALMDAFADFALQLTYPPNPLRNKDNSLTASQSAGSDFFFNFPTFFGFQCNSCHVLSPNEGFFGTNGNSAKIMGPQVMKIPHLRNAYTKAGIGRTAGELASIRFRSFGYAHAGAVPTIKDLLLGLDRGQFDFPGGPAQRTDVANWVMVIDTNLAPIVGHQVTLGATNSAETIADLTTMIQRAKVTDPRPECDLIAKGFIEGQPAGWVLSDTGQFTSDRASDAPFTLLQLIQASKVAGQEITLTCVPPGSGMRMGIDRDEDGIFDRDE